MTAPYELNRKEVRQEVRDLLAQKKLDFKDCRYSKGCVIGLLMKARGATDEELKEFDNLRGDVWTLIGRGTVMSDDPRFLSELQRAYDNGTPNQYGHFSPFCHESQQAFSKKYG